MKFATAYTHDDKRSGFFSTENTEDSLTQQDDAKDADINVIVSRFNKTGQLPQVTAQMIQGDFTNAPDFRKCQEQLKAAQDAFQDIPAKIRSRFNNDPAEFIDFATNKENLDELRKLGLAEPAKAPPKEPEPMKVIITNPPEPPK